MDFYKINFINILKYRKKYVYKLLVLAVKLSSKLKMAIKQECFLAYRRELSIDARCSANLPFISC